MNGSAARFVRFGVVLGLVLGFSAALGAQAAMASTPNASGIFLACGVGDTATPGGDSCPSFDSAVAAAKQYNGDATIEMMPGKYCPPDLSGLQQSFVHRLTFQGAGLAAYAGGSVPGGLIGQPSELTAFQWDSARCTGPVSALVTIANPGATQNFVFQNLSFVGGGTGAPSVGLSVQTVAGDNIGTTLRDVTVESWTGNSGVGVSYLGNDLQINASTFHGNNIGLQFGGEGSIDESTFAHNTTAISASNFGLHFDNTTITRNTTGFAASNFGNQTQVVNTINAFNTTDCSGPDWENASFNEDNLVGSGCTHAAAGDVVYGGNGSDVPDLATNGGPTATIMTPAPAQAIGDKSVCGSTALSVQLDQREFIKSAQATTCDAGAVQSTSYDDMPTASASPTDGTTIDFGGYPQGTSHLDSVSVHNSAAGELDVYGVTATGGFEIGNDSCTYAAMIAVTQACFVTIGTPPSATSGQAPTGTLTISTSAGDLSFPLKAAVTDPLVPPTAITGVAGDRKVSLTWPAPPVGTTAVTGYEVDYSADNGVNFNFGGFTATPSITISHLTNGVAYVFRIATDSGQDASSFSSSSGAFTPKKPSVITGPAAHTVTYGGAVTESTTLSDSSHSAIAGATVTLKYRHATTGPFASLASTTTDSSGRAHVSVTVHTKTYLEWTYAGSPSRGPAVSAAAIIAVNQAVHVAVTPTTVHHGTAVKVYGTVAPAASGRVVTIQRRSGSSWVTVGHATQRLQTLPNHAHVIGWVLSTTFRTAGTRTLRATIGATSTLGAGVSGQLTLHVT